MGTPLVPSIRELPLSARPRERLPGGQMLHSGRMSLPQEGQSLLSFVRQVGQSSEDFDERDWTVHAGGKVAAAATAKAPARDARDATERIPSSP